MGVVTMQTDGAAQSGEGAELHLKNGDGALQAHATESARESIFGLGAPGFSGRRKWEDELFHKAYNWDQMTAELNLIHIRVPGDTGFVLFLPQFLFFLGPLLL